MPEEIWVVCDEGSQPERALRLAADLSRGAGGRLRLIHVVPPGTSQSDELATELLGPPDEGAAGQARLPAGVPASVEVLEGRRDEVALAATRERRPGALLVAASGNEGRLRGLLRGDSGGALLREAPCPVMFVPPDAHHPIRTASHLMFEPTDRPMPPATDTGERSAVSPPPRRRSLLGQLVVTTTPVLVLAAVVLIVTPVSISSNPVLAEALALGAGVAIMLAIHVVLVRRTLAPLRALTEEIATVDPTHPGRRVPQPEAATREVGALAEAFNALLERVENEQRRSARRALAAQEDERLRIAREIHDQVGQTLTAATIQVERAAATEAPVGRDQLDGIARSVGQGLEDVRRIGRELRPEALDDLGLGNALITLCRRMAVPGAVRVTARLGSRLPVLTPEAELVVYRIAQEAITNALRHAEATQVVLRLERSATAIELTVADDGRGLPERVPEDTAGISGMRERARLVDGALDLRSAPGRGTEVHLAISLREATR